MTDLTIMSENYANIRTGIVELLKAARSAAARNVNSIMTAAYWEIGRRIVIFENPTLNAFMLEAIWKKAPRRHRLIW